MVGAGPAGAEDVMVRVSVPHDAVTVCVPPGALSVFVMVSVPPETVIV